VSASDYLGVFYPSGLTTDNTGKSIVVPASHMMMRTLANSDNVAFPWFAPSGTRRGVVDNATSVGYVTWRRRIPNNICNGVSERFNA
jgi:hypothetical protein